MPVTVPYLARAADAVLADMLQDHAAILVLGPRAAGKTTTCAQLARSVVRLGEAEVSRAFEAGPAANLAGRHEPILVDEWQEVPTSLQAIKTAVDNDPRRGRFIVTGSVRGDIDAVTWPGTGRLVRLPMYGLTEREMEGRTRSRSWLAEILAGDSPRQHRSNEDIRTYVQRALRSGFPEPALITTNRGRSRWLSSYVDQLVTRDAQSVSPGRDPQRLRAYLTALALNSAGVVDDITLWTAAGIAKDTARAYDTLLQNLLVIDKLPAWTSNRFKRLTLAPKRYLVDAGLFAGVLGLSEDDVLSDGDLLGRLIETFVVAQIRAEVALMPLPPRLHHLRVSDGGHEIDLVIEVGARRLLAIEVKATATPDPGDAKHLRWFRRSLPDAALTTILLHTGTETVTFADGTVATPISAIWS